MSTPRPGETLTVSELFSALDAKILDQISLVRSGRPGRNPFSQGVVGPFTPFFQN